MGVILSALRYSKFIQAKLVLSVLFSLFLRYYSKFILIKLVQCVLFPLFCDIQE